MGSQNVGLVYSYTITGLTPNALYYWFVAPYGAGSVAVGCDSPVLNGTSDGNGDLAVSWPQLSTVTGYEIEWGTVSGTYPNAKDAGNNLSGTVTGLTSGQEYFFTVDSYDANNDLSCPAPEVSTKAP